MILDFLHFPNVHYHVYIKSYAIVNCRKFCGFLFSRGLFLRGSEDNFRFVGRFWSEFHTLIVIMVLEFLHFSDVDYHVYIKSYAIVKSSEVVWFLFTRILFTGF